jgi:hypothetical protein
MPGPVAADGGTPHGAAADWGRGGLARRRTGAGGQGRTGAAAYWSGFGTAGGLGGVGRSREVR